MFKTINTLVKELDDLDKGFKLAVKRAIKEITIKKAEWNKELAIKNGAKAKAKEALLEYGALSVKCADDVSRIDNNIKDIKDIKDIKEALRMMNNGCADCNEQQTVAKYVENLEDQLKRAKRAKRAKKLLQRTFIESGECPDCMGCSKHDSECTAL